LPAITFVPPAPKDEVEILLLRRQAGDVRKQQFSPLVGTILRLWPLFLVFLVWVGLGLWVVFIQRKLD